MLNNEDAVELVLKDIVQKQDVWPILKENSYCILQRGNENKEERQSIEISNENQEMEEAEDETSEENKEKEDEGGETLSLQASEVKEREPSATEGRPLNTSVEQAHMELGE
jgi:hypothetical protein